ncbi:MAG: serine/threonine-protein kinase [Proteobacteria bacterium]|nr:serine/threonine-protein kinase [Pseudomonadota bacterium]
MANEHDDVGTVQLRIPPHLPAGEPTVPTPPTSTPSPPTPSDERALEQASRSASRSILTPEEGMRAFEARRLWTFAVALAALCTGSFAIVLGLGGDPFGQRLHLAGLGLTALAAGVYAAAYRDPARYRPNVALVVIYTSMLATGSGFVYWGVFSGFFGVVTVSGYAFASGATRRNVVLATSVSVGFHFGIGLAQAIGWLGDHALVVPSSSFSPTGQLVMLILLQVITIGAIAGGRDAQAKMRTVLDEHDAALRELSRRDAQLAEAHEAARDARGLSEGRYSGQLLGRFRLGAILGRGAMGEVYEAEDEARLGCAVKVLAAHLLADETAIRRFHREAQVIAALDAPNIVRMIEVSPPDAAVPFLAMERLAGEDLAARLKARPIWDAREVAPVIAQIAAGLAIAHRAGVVHRDLKPSNLFAALSPGGETWKVLDFGVAKLSTGDATLTVGQLIGTPGYMAPEQARGEDLDERADVYALAVIAYRLLTGRPTVIPGALPAMIHEVVFRMPPAPSQLAVVSPQVEAVRAVGLAKARGQRFATALELGAALTAAVDGRLGADVMARAAAIEARTPWGQWGQRPERKRTLTD